MKLTKKTDYALRVLQDLAMLEDTQVKSARELALGHDISLKYLQSVLAELVHAKLVQSVPGVKGGFLLNQPAERITVYSVVKSLEGEVNLMDCMEESSHCSKFSSCSIHGLFGKAQLAVYEILSSKSIADLLPCRENLKRNP